MENRYTENFRIIVDEAHSPSHSVRWKSAVSDLRRIHPDLPDVAAAAAQKLPAADPAMLANRLANTAPREVAGIGSEKMSNAEYALAVRRTHRSVTMQEAAAHIHGERESVKGASDFLSLKAAVDGGRQNQSGLVAIETLNRQGIDARRLMKDMSSKDLKAMSVGSFDRVDDAHRDRINAALEIEGEAKRDERVAQRTAPLMRPARPQFSAPRRQPNFGRKMQSQHMAAQASMAL